MVSIEQTSRKYRGRKAQTYEDVRRRQERWAIENEAVQRYLTELRPTGVLDCPVGTGRFLRLYEKLSVQEIICVDISEEMLALARQKRMRGAARWTSSVHFLVGDAREHDCVDRRVDVAVCVRFLDLIDEEAMRAVMRETCRVARRAVVLTIRLGERYVPKTNTATHDRKKFYRLVRSLGMEIAHATPVFRQGWEVMMLRRRTT